MSVLFDFSLFCIYRSLILFYPFLRSIFVLGFLVLDFVGFVSLSDFFHVFLAFCRSVALFGFAASVVVQASIDFCSAPMSGREER